MTSRQTEPHDLPFVNNRFRKKFSILQCVHIGDAGLLVIIYEGAALSREDSF